MLRPRPRPNRPPHRAPCRANPRPVLGYRHIHRFRPPNVHAVYRIVYRKNQLHSQYSLRVYALLTSGAYTFSPCINEKHPRQLSRTSCWCFRPCNLFLKDTPFFNLLRRLPSALPQAQKGFLSIFQKTRKIMPALSAALAGSSIDFIISLQFQRFFPSIFRP